MPATHDPRSSPEGEPDGARAVERVARLSYGRLVAILAARTRHVADAEDSLGDALAQALATWPVRGVPANPEGWLMAVARRRHLDGVRGQATAERLGGHLALLDDERRARSDDASAGEGLMDDRLKLLFACAHPAVDPGVRTALMLQVVLGLDVARMAGAFVTSPAALGQRLARAKRKIALAGIPVAEPPPAVMAERLDAVLAAVYAAYAVAYDGLPAGDGSARGLGEEAVWLASLLAHLLPKAAEAQGLLALMLFCEARRPARLDAAGAFVPLGQQDPALWDARLLADARSALGRAERHLSLGRFQLEAAIQAAHCARTGTGATDWPAILLLHEGLARVSPTLGALTGLAAAQGEVQSPEKGLAALDALPEAARRFYQPWWATRAQLLARLGRDDEAREAFGRAAALTDDPALRRYLTRQPVRPPVGDKA